MSPMQTSDERARLSRSGVSHGRIAASLVRSRRLFLRVNSNDAVKVGETAPFAMVRKRWMSPLTLALALFAIGSSEAIAQNASFKLLSAAQIRAKLTNKYVSDNAHWLHHYLPDGRLVLVERGREKTGRWFVRNGQLCLVRSERISEPECLDIYAQGREVEYRDKGQVIAAGSIRSSPDRSH
ncbi:hypothetical protein Bcep1808_6102 [Burkholderia vietnamiensis G4]|nr:hypothetical protein Bcep1808_1651 [Burkholderia vietnamiensis G4]ABO59021.1 hypothetical protein Bcep1808_6102 [Burkholderia vietnamiensis G4]